jgi:TRAP-type C4-dicarboxylate transport system permease small subunit
VSLFGKLWSGILKIVNFMIIILLFAMTLVVSIAVFYRYVLNNPISWGEEFSRYAMIYFAMFGAMIALMDNSHVGVSVIIDLFPDKVRRGILQFGRIFVVIFLAVVFGYSIVHLLAVNGQSSSALEIPMFIPYMSISVGALLMFLVAVRQLLGIEKVKSENEATLDEVKQGFCDPTTIAEKF